MNTGPHPSTVALVQRFADLSRARLATRATSAAEHVRLLAAHALTPDTCPVCVSCPDWINNPRSAR